MRPRRQQGALGGTPMDQDRELLAIGAWSGEPDSTLRHEAEAAGTVRPGEQFFTGSWHTAARLVTLLSGATCGNSSRLLRWCPARCGVGLRG